MTIQILIYNTTLEFNLWYNCEPPRALSSQLMTAILFSDIGEEMMLSRFVFILVANRINVSFKIHLIVKC